MKRFVTMADHYSPNSTYTFYKGKSYEVRGECTHHLQLWMGMDHIIWFNVPKRFCEEKDVDAWTKIVEETGIPRQKVKCFFFKYWHGIPIPQICQEEKLRAQDVAHMIAVFNEWADALEPGEH